MSALYLALTTWVILALLFLVATLTKNKYTIVVLMNIIFLGVSYYSGSRFLGIPKPLDMSIPLYNHSLWENGEVQLLSVFYDERGIWLLLNEEGEPRLYVKPYDQAFIDMLKKAIQEADGNVKSIVLRDKNYANPNEVRGTYYEGADSGGHSIVVENKPHKS